MSPSTIEPSGSEADQSRLISFSDNVLSVAITLLVFDVRVPANWTQLELRPAIIALLPRVLGFALSFAVIGVYWVAHHIMFRAATHVNRGMLWINNLFLMTVCLIPASAALLGAFPGQRAAVVLYGCNLLAAAGSMRLLWFYILRLPRQPRRADRSRPTKKRQAPPPGKRPPGPDRNRLCVDRSLGQLRRLLDRPAQLCFGAVSGELRGTKGAAFHED